MAIIPDTPKESPAFQTPRSEKQKTMFYLLGLVLVVAAVVVYFVFFKASPAPMTPSASPEPGGNLKLFESLKSANLENPILKDKRFEKSILFGQFPIVIGEKGRQDPFAAF